MTSTRAERASELVELSPRTDHVRIVHLLAGYEFPWDFIRALEVALFRTFASPSISRLLAATGEFGQRGQKRYDDTALLVAEFMKHGYDSPRGQAAINRMNAQHRQFRIANDDFLFVLSTFVFDPIHWVADYGWRSLTPREREALFLFWREVGERMQLQNLPESLEAMEAFATGYVARHVKFDERNRRVADATLSVVRRWFPPGSRWLVGPAVNALIDDDMRRAFGFGRPSRVLRWGLRRALKVRGRVARLLVRRRREAFFCDSPTRTYGRSYEIDKLGPPIRGESSRADEVRGAG